MKLKRELILETNNFQASILYTNKFCSIECLDFEIRKYDRYVKIDALDGVEFVAYVFDGRFYATSNGVGTCYIEQEINKDYRLNFAVSQFTERNYVIY